MSRKASPALAALAVPAACWALGLAAPAAAPAATVTDDDSLERAVAARINRVRTARDLRPLERASRLDRAAARHARSMGRVGSFRHELWTPLRSVDWTPFGTWIRWFWPGAGYSSWSAGETIFCSSGSTVTARLVVRAWMRSDGHRGILVAPRWRRVGVGAVQVSGWGTSFDGCRGDVVLVAAEFGRRA